MKLVSLKRIPLEVVFKRTDLLDFLFNKNKVKLTNKYDLIFKTKLVWLTPDIIIYKT